MTQKPPRSLKSRALQLLAQREQSRVELRRKLLVHALADDAARAHSRSGEGGRGRDSAAKGSSDPALNAGHDATAGIPSRASRLADPGVTAASGTGTKSAHPLNASGTDDTSYSHGDSSAADAAASRVDALLDWLDAQRFLSDERFAESRINARAGRYGALRIRQELKQHGVALGAHAARVLNDSEAARAWTVWERRFSKAPDSSADTARQARFLTARGFSTDAVCQVLRRARDLRIDIGPAATDD